MEVKFILGIFLSLFGTLFGGMVDESSHSHEPKQCPPSKVVESIAGKVNVNVKSDLKVPKWVNFVPKGHFSGVSNPSSNLAEARNSAVSDVVRQILGCVGISYRHVYHNNVSGNPRHPVQRVSDSLTGVAHGLIFDVEKSIVASSYDKDFSGRYVVFVLVEYSDAKIAEVRRLSKGSSVTIKRLRSRSNKSGFMLKATESNGVAVVLSSADIRIVRVNRFAKLMNFFWNAESGSERSISVPIGPVNLCSSSSDFLLDLDESSFSISDYLLGAKITYFVKVKGQDEVGRVVEVNAEF